MSPELADAVEKVFWGIYENFLKLLMRSVRGDVRDHIASQKNDHGLPHRNYKAPQRRSSPKITICEIFGVVRFSTFSTASARLRHAKRLNDVGLWGRPEVIAPWSESPNRSGQPPKG
jgi:hypothetical protein